MSLGDSEQNQNVAQGLGDSSEALDHVDETSTGETRIRKDRTAETREDGLPAELGEILGGYQLESVLGRGGMGCVYLGRHQVLKREAAIKVLASQLSGDQAYVSRFFHEAQIVNEVNHPNIVEIIDFVEVKKPLRVAYVMEVLRGHPLSNLVNEISLSFQQTMNLCFQLCDALVAVHAAGVVHRDLKPENIFVVGSLDSDFTYVPSVKILDFGIAKKQAGNVSHQTATGAIIGTPAYMAPEQISGERITDKTDVYAMGEILYEMLTGKRLFTGQNMEIMRSKLIHEVPKFTLPPETPDLPRITSLLTQAMLQNASKRPTMKQFARAILEFCPEISPSRMSSSTALLNPAVLMKTPLPTAVSDSTDFPAPLAPEVSLSSSGAKKSRVVLGVTLLVLALVVGASFLWQSQGEEAVGLPIESIPAKKKTIKKKPPPIVKRPVLVPVKLLSEPPSAEVFDAVSNARLGTTPLTLEVNEGQDKKIRLELPGYKSLITFLSSRDKEKGFVLVQQPRDVRAPVTKKIPAKKIPAKKIPATKEQPKEADPFSKREVPEW